MRSSRSLIAAVMLAGLWPAQTWAADYLADGKRALQSGDLRTAQIQFRNAVKDNPKDAEANYQLGVVSLRLGDAPAAEKDAISAQNLGYDPKAASALAISGYLAEQRFKDLLRDFPAGTGSPETQAAILVGRGQAQLGLDQVDQAQASFAEARRLAPNAPEPLLAEAQLAIGRKDLAGANQKVEAALAVAPNSPEALQRHSALLADLGDRKGALAAADQAVAAAPGQYAYRLSRAGLLLAFNDDAGAKSDIDSVLTSMPNNAQAIYDRAVLRVRAKDYKGADEDLLKLSEYISRYPAGYLLLAIVKQHIGQNEQALDAATRYVGRNPNDPRGALLLAELDLQAKQYNQAIAALTPLANAGTKDANIYDLRGRALSAVGRLREAADDFQRGLAITPNNPALLARLGATELPLGNAEYARVLLAKSVELAPDQAPTQELLAEADLASGRLDDAKTSIAKLASMKVDPEATANMAGLLKLANFDLPGARADFVAILHDHPDSNAAQLNLARVARLQGQFDEASGILTKVLQRDPTQDRAVDDLTALLIQQQKIPDAVAVLERAHAAAPGNVKFLTKLAELYIASGDPTKALALVSAPEASVAATPGGAAAPVNPINALPQLLIRAQAQLALKQGDAAVATYRQILAINPELTFVRLQLIRILAAGGDNAGASALVRDGLALQPQNTALLQASLALDAKTGGVDVALASADQLGKKIPTALPFKGDLLMEAHRFDDAAKAYGDALKTAPSATLETRLATALNAGGHPDQAAQTLRSWLEQHPGDIETSMALADFDILAMKLPEAKTLLSGVLEKQPANVTALNNMAWVQQQINDPDARATAERAYMLAPTPQSADTLGYILATEKRGDSGLSLLRQASAQLPGDPSVQYHYAVALKASGQAADAVKVLTQLVALPQDFREKPDARKLLSDLAAKP